MVYIDNVKTTIVCKYCNSKTIIKKGYLHMICMCDDEIRTVNVDFLDIKEFDRYNLYLLSTEGNNLCHDGNLHENVANQ